MSLKLENARYEYQDNYPILVVDIDDEPASFTTEWKPTLRERGYVPAGSDALADRIGTVTITNLDGHPVEVHGITNDRRLVELYRRFWESCQDGTFAPGPIEIPDA